MPRNQTKWDQNKLDTFEREFERRVRTGLAHELSLERDAAEVLGYWLHKLRDCKVPAKRKGQTNAA